MTFFTGILQFGISLESQHAMRKTIHWLRLHNDEAYKTMNLQQDSWSMPGKHLEPWCGPCLEAPIPIPPGSLSG